MRNCVSSLNIINPFLKRSHKTHSINDLIHRRIVRKVLNSLYYKLLLIHDPILRRDGEISNASSKSCTNHIHERLGCRPEFQNFRMHFTFPRTLGVLRVLCAKSSYLR